MKKLLIIVLFFLLTTYYSLLTSLAFVGPQAGQTVGTGGGGFVIDSSGNIGFGTSAPAPTSNFDATSTQSGPTSFGYVFTVASTTNPGVALKNLSSGNMYLWSSRNFGNFQLYRESATLPGLVVVDINQYGDVAIAAKATSTGISAKLLVGGNIQSTGSFIGALSGNLSAANVTGPSAFGANYGTYNYAFPGALAVGTSTTAGLPTNGLYVGGSVGIGTVSPYQAKLDVNGIGSVAQYAASNSNNDQLLIGSVNRGSSSYFGLATGATFVMAVGNGVANSMGIGTFGAQPLILGTNNAAAVTILSGGNVGIGTSTPTHKLTVTGGDIYFDGSELIFSDAGTSNRDYIIYNDSPFMNSGGSFTFQADTTLGGATSTPTAGISAEDAYFSGNVGIGTGGPGEKLTVSGNILLISSFPNIDSSGSELNIRSQAAPIYFRNRADNTVKAVINTSSGNVGIATTTPGYPLTVNGVIYSVTGGFRFPDNSVTILSVPPTTPLRPRPWLSRIQEARSSTLTL
ncbi:MAG: hypothetical protein UY51_C0005G0449 [Candidatus Jorgensenbacteria bacterium GW2011_GWB1_49_9]|nr:MAG: hypothetical protein UY51_C0005G0449 [Candidatus Jorgensenbacteria bacterium GW2011_GWB1_49_9]